MPSHSSSDYRPASGLRNRHVQSLMNALPPRKWRVHWSSRRWQAAAEPRIIDCDNGVQLLAEYNAPAFDDPAKPLMVLLHGWKGCSRSTYMLSLGQRLSAEGYPLLRLNLRDHGPSLHLNEELFHSARLSDLTQALSVIARDYGQNGMQLIGYSLGGNFALRAASAEPPAALTQVYAVCPLLDPAKTMAALNEGWFVYRQHFTARWKAALLGKLEHFPELGYGDDIKKLQTLDELNHYFIPRFTPYKELDQYFDAYRITGDRLDTLACPAHIIASEDDPIILSQDLDSLSGNSRLSVERTQYGGHCGFVENWRFDCWVEQRIMQLMHNAAAPHETGPGKTISQENRVPDSA